MRTTLNISDALLEEVRDLARRESRPANAVFEELLQRGLSSARKAAGPARIRTFKLGVKPAYRGVSLNQLYDQIEAGKSGVEAGQ